MLRIPHNLLQIRLLSTQVTHSIAAKQELDKLFKNIEFEVRGHDKAVLQSYMSFVQVEFGFLRSKIKVFYLECMWSFEY